MGKLIIVLGIGLLVGYRLGFEVAQLTVARECERLGGFYVKDKTYRCVEIVELSKAGGDQ